jgi:hypothetical protein
MKYLKANFEAFTKYIKERYTSRDGFISFHSNYAPDWLVDWDGHKVGSILNFICLNEGFEEPNYFDDLHISFFYTDEINQYENNRN